MSNPPYDFLTASFGNNVYVEPKVIVRAVFDIESMPIYICSHYATWDPWCVDTDGWDAEEEEKRRGFCVKAKRK